MDAAVEVHRPLGGPGLLECVYEEALMWELTGRGVEMERRKSLPIVYKGSVISTPLKPDLLAGGKVIVECKAIQHYDAIFEA